MAEEAAVMRRTSSNRGGQTGLVNAVCYASAHRSLVSPLGWQRSSRRLSLLVSSGRTALPAL